MEIFTMRAYVLPLATVLSRKRRRPLFRLRRAFLSGVNSKESAENTQAFMKRSHSKIAEGVREVIRQN